MTALERLRLHALHTVARAALRLRAPMPAKAIVDRLGRGMRPLHGVPEARDAVVTLGASGSCLSRAIAVAACVPGAQVVLGVDLWNASQVSAHAWLEIDGQRLDPQSTAGVGGRNGVAFQGEEIGRFPPTRCPGHSFERSGTVR